MNDELGMISNEGTGAIMNYELEIREEEYVTTHYARHWQCDVHTLL